MLPLLEPMPVSSPSCISGDDGGCFDHRSQKYLTEPGGTERGAQLPQAWLAWTQSFPFSSLGKRR